MGQILSRVAQCECRRPALCVSRSSSSDDATGGVGCGHRQLAADIAGETTHAWSFPPWRWGRTTAAGTIELRGNNQRGCSLRSRASRIIQLRVREPVALPAGLWRRLKLKEKGSGAVKSAATRRRPLEPSGREGRWPPNTETRRRDESEGTPRPIGALVRRRSPRCGTGHPVYVQDRPPGLHGRVRDATGTLRGRASGNP